MKKMIASLIACALVLSASAMLASQPDARFLGDWYVHTYKINESPFPYERTLCINSPCPKQDDADLKFCQTFLFRRLSARHQISLFPFDFRFVPLGYSRNETI